MSLISAPILSRHPLCGLCGGFFVLMSVFLMNPAPVCAQQVTTYAIPASAGGVPGTFASATCITTGPDGALWFGGTNHIGRITTSGAITGYTTPTSNIDITGITAGPDGALWFTEAGPNSQISQIGRITTSGAITEYVVPTNTALPYAITTGPDGNLWFTESEEDKVGRITTAGVITEFKAPSNTGGYTSQIVTGPDGNMWFTNGYTISKLTTQGVVTQYQPGPIINTYGGLSALAVGPDGNLYVLFSTAELTPPALQLGQISTSGALTLSTLSSEASSPLGMATGPDGALWFTDDPYFTSGVSMIGRIALPGTLTEYPMPSSLSGYYSQPNQITAGPDGAMWFAGPDYIGRIVTSATVTPPTLIATPPSLTVTSVVNGPNIVEAINLTSNSATTPVNISSVTSGANPWDSVQGSAGPTPSSVLVSLFPNSLVAKTYADTITVTSNATNSPLRIPVTFNVVASMPPSTNDYYFSQLSFAGNWQMTLTYINYSPQAVTCTTNFYSDSGTPLPVPFTGGTASFRTDVLQPGQSIHDQTVASLTAPVTEGWAHASCTGPIQASLLYRLYSSGAAVGEAAVNAEAAPTTKFVTFAQTATGVAYANPSSTQTASVTFTVFSSAGAQLASKTIPVAPLQHSAFNVASGANAISGLGPFTGWIEITSTVPIISLSLNAEAFPSFSSMPPGDLPASSPASGATDYYFSQLAFAGEFQMALTYINYSAQSVTCTTNFYSDSGVPLLVPFPEGTMSTRTDVLLPGQSIHDQTIANLAASVSQGWAHASCTGPLQASLLYRLFSPASNAAVGEAAVNAETTPTTKFVTFAQTATGVAYGNPSSTQTASVTFTVFSSAGAQLASKTISVGPLQHGAFNVASGALAIPNLGPFTGWIAITSTSPIVSLSLNAEAFPSFSSMPPGDLPASTVLVIQ
jgi:streptogramin lyase